MTWDCKLFFLVLLVSVLPSRALETAEPDTLRLKSAAEIQDRWFAKDKGDHFVASAVLAGFGYYIAKQELKIEDAQTFAVGFSLSFGILKEVYDGPIRKGRPSLKDLAADIAGIGLGFLMINMNGQ